MTHIHKGNNFMAKAKQIIFPQTKSEEIADFYKKIAPAIRKKYFDKYHAHDDVPELRRFRIYDICSEFAVGLSILFGGWIVADFICMGVSHLVPIDDQASVQFMAEHSWNGFLFPIITICCTVLILLFDIFTAVNYRKYDKITDEHINEQDKIIEEIKQLLIDNDVLNREPPEYLIRGCLLPKEKDPFDTGDFCWMYSYLRKLEKIKTDDGQYDVANDGHDIYVSLCINGFEYQTQKLANFDIDEFTAITAKADESIYGKDQGIYDFTIIDDRTSEWMNKIKKNIIGG